MRTRVRCACAVLAAVALVMAFAGCGDTAGGSAAASRDDNWALPNADLANTRRAAGSIDAASVRDLEPTWAVTFDEVVSNPVIAGGVAYVQDVSSNVFALALTDGRVLWQRRYNQPSVGPNGVTVGDGRVYGATPTKAFALDARTGDPLWSRTLVANDHEGIDMAPGYWHGTVYVATVPANVTVTYGAGGRGVLWALDGATGRPRWRWDTVPADLWGHPEVNAGGGLWHPPAFDGRGYLYASIGNPAPWSGTPRYPWAASRPGPNRWTNSIVKLDALDGRLVWGRQVAPHDLYDWDLQCPVILTRAQGRAVAVVAGKMGFVYSFDRADGTLLWKRSVGVHNGHDDDGRKMMTGAIAEPQSSVRVFPGVLGGVETPMAVDEDTVYVPVENLASIYTGTALGEPAPLGEASGELVAIDLASGRVRWDRRLPASAFGAATVVNNLVLTPTYDGTLWALRTADGSVAWKGALPAGSNAPLAIAEDTLLAGAGVSLTSGQTRALVAYRLRR
jgi:outer membrane protein assembly factor BamB